MLEVEKMDITKLLSAMTLEEKASLCSGLDFWHLEGIEHLNIPSIMVADGPHGLRKQEDSSDHLGIYESTHLSLYTGGYGRRPHTDLAGADPCRDHSMCGIYTEQDLPGCPEGCNPRRYLRG